jgi:membrane associated rhomboid family serine protease
MGLDQRDYYRDEPDGPTQLRGWWATLAMSHKLVAVNLAVFILWQVHALQPFMQTHFTTGWKGVFGHGRVWTLVTSAFSHQDLGHLFWNMLYLHWFGVDLEQVYGKRNFLLLYLYGGVCCSLGHLVYEHGWGHDAGMLGASGAVMAVVIATALFFPQRTILFMFFLPVPLWALALFKVLGDLAGVVGGAGVTFKLLDLRLFLSPGQETLDGWRWPGLRAVLGRLWPARSAPAGKIIQLPPRPQVDGDTAVRVDDLLRKIHAQGKDSLTPEELEFLKAASERYKRP